MKPPNWVPGLEQYLGPSYSMQRYSAANIALDEVIAGIKLPSRIGSQCFTDQRLGNRRTGVEFRLGFEEEKLRFGRRPGQFWLL